MDISIAFFIGAIVYIAWSVTTSIKRSRVYRQHVKAVNGLSKEIDRCLINTKIESESYHDVQ